MKLILELIPRAGQPRASVSVNETTLTIDGADYDLSELPDRASATHPVLRTISRNGDEYTCAIVLGHGYNAPPETRYPEPIVLENHNGSVELPPYDTEIIDELD